MRNDWWSCDGDGNSDGRPMTDDGNSTCRPAISDVRHPTPDTRHPAVSRRQLLFGGALAGVWWVARPGTALSDVAVKPGKGEPAGDVLVNIFLRGGADGLNIVPPYAEDEYHRARPSLRVAAPRDPNSP